MTEEIRSVSSTGGEKGVKLERFDLIPIEALTALATHYGVGARKYADNQWRKGYEWSKSYAALQRHLTAWWGGEDIDAETGSSHLAAVAWHAFTLLTFVSEHPDFDDRFKAPERPAEDEEDLDADEMPLNYEEIERYIARPPAPDLASLTLKDASGLPKFGPMTQQEPQEWAPVKDEEIERYVVGRTQGGRWARCTYERPALGNPHVHIVHDLNGRYSVDSADIRPIRKDDNS